MTRQLIAALAAIMLCASAAAAASITVLPAEINTSQHVQRDLGCTWDRDVNSVRAWAYYAAGDGSLTMELLSPQAAANGRTLVLAFSTDDLAMAGKPLVRVDVMYETTTPKC